MSTSRVTVTQQLLLMGFPIRYIQRAFRVYKKNYGHSYNIEVLTEIILRLQNKDKAKRVVNSLWDNQLSYNSLNAKGLINSRHEWLSVKQTFYNKQTSASSVLKWLRNENQTFRYSYLSYIFMSGYIGTISKQFYIPLDIQNILLSFCHIIFIKLYFKCNDNINYELRTFDCNFTFNNLMKILEFEYHSIRAKTEHFIRIWCRYDAMKVIYHSILQKEQINPLSCYFDDGNKNRWVELTNNYYSLTINDIDRNLSYNEIVEVGVDLYDKINDKYSFILDDKQPSFISNHTLNRLEWISSLKIGDIINVRKSFCMDCDESIIVYRDFDTFYVYCIKSSCFRYVKSIEYQLGWLQPRYIDPHSWHNRYAGKLYECTLITDFKKVNDQSEFGVLFQ